MKRNTSGIKPHQFKKGVSGNPKGAPHKLPELHIILAEVLGETKDGKTAAQAILMKLRQTAMGSVSAQSIRAAELLLNRGYGLPKQIVDLNANIKSIQVEYSDNLAKDSYTTSGATPGPEDEKKV